MNHTAEPQTQFFEIVERLTEAVGRAAAHALRTLEEAARLGDVVRAQQAEIAKLGEAVQLHQRMFEAIAKPISVEGPKVH